MPLKNSFWYLFKYSLGSLGSFLSPASCYGKISKIQHYQNFGDFPKPEYNEGRAGHRKKNAKPNPSLKLTGQILMYYTIFAFFPESITQLISSSSFLALPRSALAVTKLSHMGLSS